MYLEVCAKTASKYNAVKYLRDTYGFDKIVCFGDNLNDLPMFSASDVRIAVSNAKDVVKVEADIIIGTNTKNGVANWLLANAK